MRLLFTGEEHFYRYIDMWLKIGQKDLFRGLASIEVGWWKRFKNALPMKNLTIIRHKGPFLSRKLQMPIPLSVLDYPFVVGLWEQIFFSLTKPFVSSCLKKNIGFTLFRGGGVCNKSVKFQTYFKWLRPSFKMWNVKNVKIHI